MKPSRFLKHVLAIIAFGAIAIGAFLTRNSWLPWLQHSDSPDAQKPATEAVALTDKIIVTDQAQKNLGITAQYLKAGTFLRTISLPGMVVDRAGVSDQGIVAPVTGQVTRIHFTAGDTVRPGDVLFTIKLLSESLHATQTELRKTAQDISLAQTERKRLGAISGVIPETRLIEIDNQIKRLETAERAHIQELLSRGLMEVDIAAIRKGEYVSQIHVLAPPTTPGAKPLTVSLLVKDGKPKAPIGPAFELQEIKVDVGHQVQVGQTLCTLANHHSLSVEGKAFPDETRLLQRSFKERWPVEVEFPDDTPSDWEEIRQTFLIRSIANSIDPATRTVTFLLPLENQSKPIAHDDATRLVWRFRPGQKARLRIRVEEVTNVFVLPADAVVRDGPEAFIFTQNVNTFERKSVTVLFQERGRIVVANDGLLPTYQKDKEGSLTTPKEKETWTIPAVVQGAAAQINRMGKAGTGGIPKGYHIHADGSLHKNEDEGK